MKYRLKFSKTGKMKFIGHLDLIRMFQKLFRQGDIPMEYSKGFNPHQIFSIASPLSVGITSECEYLDMKLTKDLDVNLIIDKVNRFAPEGLKILEGEKIDDNSSPVMSLVTAGKYKISQEKIIISEKEINEFIKQENIIILKKSKKGIVNEIDIKPGIYNLSIKDNIIIMTIATGSAFNIKPEALIESILNYNQIEYNPFNFKVHRVELYLDNILPN